MVTLANPFDFDSALASAMGDPGSATALESDPPVAVAAHSSSCGGAESRSAFMNDGLNICRLGVETPVAPVGHTAGIASGPQDSISVSAISAEGVAIVTPEETPVPVVAVASNSELAEVSRADIALQRGTPSHSRSPGTRGKKDQASIPPIGPRSLPTGPTPAADALTGSAAFSLDVRIHNIMLAVADELADEQRTINERLLLRQFARQS